MVLELCCEHGLLTFLLPYGIFVVVHHYVLIEIVGIDFVAADYLSVGLDCLLNFRLSVLRIYCIPF